MAAGLESKLVSLLRQTLEDQVINENSSRPRSTRFLVIVGVFVLLLTSCVQPFGDQEKTFNDSPLFRIRTLTGVDGEPFSISIVFAEPDVTNLGLPTEAPFLAVETFAEGNVALEVDVRAEALFVRTFNEDPVLESLGCFESPIEIRNDETSEILLTVTDYCPNKSTQWNLALSGVVDPGPLGWNYLDGNNETVNVRLE